MEAVAEADGSTDGIDFGRQGWIEASGQGVEAACYGPANVRNSGPGGGDGRSGRQEDAALGGVNEL